MYLLKPTTTKHGITASCWALEQVSFQYKSASDTYACQAVLNLYHSDMIRKAGGPYVDSCTVSWKSLSAEHVESNIMSNILTLLNTPNRDTGGTETTYRTTFSGPINFADAALTGE
jgi:hypothetical protein